MKFRAKLATFPRYFMTESLLCGKGCMSHGAGSGCGSQHVGYDAWRHYICCIY